MVEKEGAHRMKSTLAPKAVFAFAFILPFMVEYTAENAGLRFPLFCWLRFIL